MKTPPVPSSSTQSALPPVGADLRTFSRGSWEEHWISARVDSRAALELLLSQWRDWLSKTGAEPLIEWVFDHNPKTPAPTSAQETGSRLWYWGEGESSADWISFQAWAVSGLPVKRLPNDKSGICVKYFEDEWACYAVLTGVRARHLQQSPAEQVTEAYRALETRLAAVGMRFQNIIRMWNFLDHILDWYTDFNKARTAFFSDRSIFDAPWIPAATGIGAANVFGAAYFGVAFAVLPKSDACAPEALPSPLQCPAVQYRSSFSRAMELKLPNRHQILVSGTASIAPDAKTIFQDDIAGQIERTMEVVEAILASRGMNFQNTVRAIVYYKDFAHLPYFDKYCRRRGLNLCLVHVRARVCRDDLLFEIELDAEKVLDPKTLTKTRGIS